MVSCSAVCFVQQGFSATQVRESSRLRLDGRGGGHMGACGLQLSLWLLPTCGLKAAVREADCVPLCCAVLCVCCVIRYKHMDMADLEAQLQAADAAGTRVKLIATGEGGGWSCERQLGRLQQVV